MRGLRDFEKRKYIFALLKQHKTDIAFLQECHCTAEDETMWEKQWGGKIFYSHGTQNSRGNMILFKRNLIDMNPCIIPTDSDRLLAVKIKVIDDTDCLLVNIYGPNQDDINFITKISELIKENISSSIIMGGDFNIPLDFEKDSTAKTDNKRKSRYQMQQLIDAYTLWDVWRVKHEGTLKYTWFSSQNRTIMSRLDYFLVSSDVILQTQQAEIDISAQTDHNLVSFVWRNKELDRGPGLWKFNNTMLRHKDFLTCMNQTIECAQQVYAKLDPILKWEMVKHDIIKTAKDFAKKLSMKKQEKRNELEKVVKLCLAEMQHRQTPQLENKLQEAQLTLETFEKEKLLGSIFRSKVQWYGEGEKNSRYFFSIEKNRFKARSLQEIYVSDDTDETTTDIKRILNIAATFYRELYTSRNSNPFSLENTYDKGVSNLDNRRFFSKTELNATDVGEALSLLANNKTPGCDGLTADFYKVFWPNLKTVLINYYNECYIQKVLGWTARRGILSLIPKKGKNPLSLKNWRPITLLNIDYKILSKILAKMLKNVLPQLIAETQTGFMQGRNIRSNIRKTIEIATKSSREKLEYIIFSIDFEKCFDSCRTEALIGALKFFNIQEEYVNWVSLLFQEFSLSVQNCGYRSTWEPQTRGLHQGCCWSPIGYLLCGEIFALVINTLPNIKENAAFFFEVLNLLSQFADDTDIFTKFKQTVVNQILEALDYIELHLGLKVNYEKSTLYRIGSLRESNAKFYTIKPVSWSNEPLNVLGVVVHSDLDKRIDLNFRPLIEKVQNILLLWESRNLTLTGRVLIVNTLIESLFVHKMSTIEMMSEELLQTFQKIILKFVWKNRRPKIAYSILSLPKKLGGLRLVNLKQKHRAILISWIPEICKSPFFQNCCYENLLPSYGDYIWKVNLKAKDVKQLGLARSFWKDILCAWCLYNYTESISTDNVMFQSLWLNSLLKVNNKLQINENAVKRGLLFFKDIWDVELQSIKSHETAKLEFNVTMTWLEYHVLVNSIPKEWILLAKQLNVNLGESTLFENIFTKKCLVKHVYTQLTTSTTLLTRRYEKWTSIFPFEMEEYIRSFAILYKNNLSTKMRDFQYRILMRTIVTNIDLKRWKLKDDDKCIYCNEPEDQEHIFYYCPNTHLVLKEFKNYCETTFNCLITVSLKNIMLGQIVDIHPHAINGLVTVLKQCIYKGKCEGITVNFAMIKRRFSEIQKIERVIAEKENQLENFSKKWSSILDENDVLNSVVDGGNISDYIKNYFA